MINQTMEKLVSMRLSGLVQALKAQLENPAYQDLPFEHRIADLVDTEYLKRQNTKLQKRIREARLKQNAAIEDVDFQAERKLSKTKLLELATCSWVQSKLNLCILGPTGVGKTFIACALGNKACRAQLSTFYIKTPELVTKLLVAKADGSYPKLAAKLAKYNLLIIDEWLRDPLPAQQSRDILDIIDDRFRNNSTIFVAQIPINEWYQHISDPTIADAILDRVVHDSIRLELCGESMRKKTSTIPK